MMAFTFLITLLASGLLVKQKQDYEKRLQVCQTEHDECDTLLLRYRLEEQQCQQTLHTLRLQCTMNNAACHVLHKQHVENLLQHCDEHTRDMQASHPSGHQTGFDDLVPAQDSPALLLSIANATDCDLINI
jgi:hypothetical protein